MGKFPDFSVPKRNFKVFDLYNDENVCLFVVIFKKSKTWDISGGFECKTLFIFVKTYNFWTFLDFSVPKGNLKILSLNTDYCNSIAVFKSFPKRYNMLYVW